MHAPHVSLHIGLAAEHSPTEGAGVLLDAHVSLAEMSLQMRGMAVLATAHPACPHLQAEQQSCHWEGLHNAYRGQNYHQESIQRRELSPARPIFRLIDVTVRDATSSYRDQISSRQEKGFVGVFLYQDFLYQDFLNPQVLLCWHWGNHMIAPVPAK